MGVIPSSIFAPGFFKRSKLQIKVLVKGRNACVAYLHLDKSLQKSPQKVPLLQDTFAKPLSLGKRPLEELSQNLGILRIENRRNGRRRLLGTDTGGSCTRHGQERGEPGGL